MKEECRFVLLTRGEIRAFGARLMGLQGRKYKLWWSGNQEGYGGVGVLVKKLCDQVIEVRRVNDRVMSLAIVFEEVLRVVWAYAPQSGKLMEEREFFYEDLSAEWTTHHTSELIIGMRDFNGHVGRNIDGFQGVNGGFSIGERNQDGRMLLEFCDAKHLYIANAWFRKADNKKIHYGSGCNESEVDFSYNGKSRSEV